MSLLHTLNFLSFEITTVHLNTDLIPENKFHNLVSLTENVIDHFSVPSEIKNECWWKKGK
jgi:hypothetical protein